MWIVREALLVGWKRKGVYKNSLYFALNFAVNLKLFKRMAIIEKTREMWRKGNSFALLMGM